MSGPCIPNLRTTLRDLFQGLADYHQALAEETGEAVHIANWTEFRAGTIALDTLVDQHDRFVDHKALVTVRQALVHCLDVVADGSPLTQRLFRSLIRQIDAVEKVAFSEDAMAA